MAKPEATILIAARDAAATIARAVRSARAQGPYPIVLIDDHSADGTADVARCAVPGVIVVTPPHHGLLGFTRQCGLDRVETPFALWLDADDELLPGRTQRMVDALTASEADLAFDEVELVDGTTGRFLRHCPIPSFFDSPPHLFRQFERNHLPGVGQVAFRTASARRVGYDPDLHGTEDSDFLLRALLAGLATTLIRTPGYRMYAYPQSVSRRLDAQRAMYRKALLKHVYAEVAEKAAATGASQASIAWVLASMAIFREEYEAARQFVETAAADLECTSSRLDDGDPLPAAWRVAFARGTLDALVGHNDIARHHLEAAEDIQPTPESANNLGVVLARLGEDRSARACFERALSTSSAYVDAQLNLRLASPDRITSHPLRRFAARTDYAISPPAHLGSETHS